MSETCHHMFEQIIVSNYKWYIILYILYIFKTYVLLCTIYSKKNVWTCVNQIFNQSFFEEYSEVNSIKSRSMT